MFYGLCLIFIICCGTSFSLPINRWWLTLPQTHWERIFLIFYYWGVCVEMTHLLFNIPLSLSVLFISLHEGSREKRGMSWKKNLFMQCSLNCFFYSNLLCENISFHFDVFLTMGWQCHFFYILSTPHFLLIRQTSHTQSNVILLNFVSYFPSFSLRTSLCSM